MLDSKLAAPQGFEPRYADPESESAYLLNCLSVAGFAANCLCQQLLRQYGDLRLNVPR